MVWELHLNRAVTKKVYCGGLSKCGADGDGAKWMNLRDISEVKSTGHTDKFDLGVVRRGNVEEDSGFLLTQWSRWFWHSL